MSAPPRPLKRQIKSDNYLPPLPVFSRCIAAADCECVGGCDIEEGTLFYKDKRLDRYCVECHEYELNKENRRP